MAKSSRAGQRQRGGDGARRHGLFEDLLAMAGTLAGSRKEYAAAKLETLAESVREFAAAVPEIPNLESYASAAADSLEGLAEYVNESDFETMVRDARDFAREHPVVTLAGTIAAGLVAAQMMHARGGVGQVVQSFTPKSYSNGRSRASGSGANA